jgi:hypothetical protein
MLRKVYGLGQLLSLVGDGRRCPQIAKTAVLLGLLFMVTMGFNSLHDFEPKLADKTFWRLIGGSQSRRTRRKLGRLRRLHQQGGKPAVCSGNTMRRTACKLELDDLREVLVHVNRRAERNKVFREGGPRARQYSAIDCVETSRSRKRHCAACLSCTKSVEDKEVQEYYHRYVVLWYLGPGVEVILDAEPVLSCDIRAERGMPSLKKTGVTGHEGELTAAKRMLTRAMKTYGSLIDVVVGDALYACGPMLELLANAPHRPRQLICTVKKENTEPLKDALALWGRQPAQGEYKTRNRYNRAIERVALWDSEGHQSLMSYDGSLRVVRAVVKKLPGPRTPQAVGAQKEPITWCALTTLPIKSMSARQVIEILRWRWHIENGFHQLKHRWHLKHVMVHHATGTHAMVWITLLAFTLMQLFLFRYLRRFRESGQTIMQMMAELRESLARLIEPIELLPTIPTASD